MNAGQRSGFTIIELIIAMSLGAAVMAVVVGMMSSQGRFVERMDARSQQTERVRSALETISNEVSELTRGSVTLAKADSVSYRLPVAWGVVCGALDRKGKTAGNLVKLLTGPLSNYQAAVHMEPLPRSMGTPAPDGFAYSSNGEDWTYFPVSDWNSLGLATSENAKDACLDDDDKGRNAKLAASGDYKVIPALATVLGLFPADRSLVFAYVNVTYSLKDESSGGRGQVLYRSDKSGADRLAWPFGPGATFQYRLDDMSEGSSVVVANLPRVRWIRTKLPPPANAVTARVTLDTVTFEPWVPMINARN